MSIDRSLRSGNMLVRHRNVLNRVERLERLKEEEKWNDEKTIFGLPKVGNRKVEIVKKEAAVAAVEGAAAPAAGAAAPAAPAAGAKGAAPAAAGKAAAPAAKAAPKK